MCIRDSIKKEVETVSNDPLAFVKNSLKKLGCSNKHVDEKNHPHTGPFLLDEYDKS